MVGKAASSHNHDDRYFTETEINNKLKSYLPLTGGKITGNIEATGGMVAPRFGTSTAAQNGVNIRSYSGTPTGGAIFMQEVYPEGGNPYVAVGIDGLGATGVGVSKWAGGAPWNGITGKPSTYPPSSHNHDDRYYTETEIDSKLGGKADSSHKHTKSQITDFPTSLPASDVHDWAKAKNKPAYAWSEITGKPSTFAPASHTHDDRYYTESEINSKLANCVTIFGSSSSAMANIFGANCIYSASQCIGFQPGASGTADANNYAVHLRVADSLWGWMPTKNGYVNLGTPNHRWAQPYFSASPNVSSDRNVKKDISEISDQYLQFFAFLRPVTYRLIGGQSGRIHVGFIAQDVEAAMEQAGLIDLEFAGFCKDIKTHEVIVKRQRQKQDANGTPLVDEDGTPIMEEYDDVTYEDELDEDGNSVYIYSLRYEEFIALDTAVIQRQQSRIEGLEERIAKLEHLVVDMMPA